MRTTKFDLMMNSIAVVVLAAATLFLLLNWENLPERIPSHYNFKGEPDAYGGTGSLIFLMVTGWIIVLMMCILGKFPKYWNTGVERTPANEAVINRIVKDMMGVMIVSISLLFSYMLIVPVLQMNMGVWFMPLMLFVIFGTMIVTVVRLIRNR